MPSSRLHRPCQLFDWESEPQILYKCISLIFIRLPVRSPAFLEFPFLPEKLRRASPWGCKFMAQPSARIESCTWPTPLNTQAEARCSDNLRTGTANENLSKYGKRL